MDHVAEMAQTQEDGTFGPCLFRKVLPAGMSDIGTIGSESHAFDVRTYALSGHDAVDERAEGA